MTTAQLILRYVGLSAIASNDPELAAFNFSGFLQLENNPKLHAIAKIADSIKRHKFRDPLAWDRNLNKGKGGIVEGNGRLEALLLLKSKGEPAPEGILTTVEGDWAIPILFGLDADSEAEAIAYSLDHNSLVLPEGATAQEVASLYSVQGYLEQLRHLEGEGELPQSVSIDDYKALIESLDKSQPPPDEPPKPEQKPSEGTIREGMVIGSLWQLGRHRLYCGDITQETAIASLLKGFEPGIVWGNPPRNPQEEDAEGVATVAPILFLKRFPKALQIWWGANCFSSDLPSSPCWIVWDKGGGEAIELAWTNQTSSACLFKQRWEDNENNPQKLQPVELIEWFWGKFAPNINFCFDPFLGRGASILAAQRNENRIVFGSESTPKACELILQAWENQTQEEAELIQ